MHTLKILVVSQKGGVGKSTFSTNFAAWCGERKNFSTTLLDFDPHASSSVWIKELSPKNVHHKEVSSSDFSAQRWFMGARSTIRKVESTCDIAIADVTWTKGMNANFLTEFHLIIVPTSVSQLDVDATHDFITKNIRFFKEQRAVLSNQKITPALMLLPSMVTSEQLQTNPFTTRNFDFPFLLLPLRSLVAGPFGKVSWYILCKPFQWVHNVDICSSMASSPCRARMSAGLLGCHSSRMLGAHS